MMLGHLVIYWSFVGIDRSGLVVFKIEYTARNAGCKSTTFFLVVCRDPCNTVLCDSTMERLPFAVSNASLN